MAIGRGSLLVILALYCGTVLAAGDESTELQSVNDKRYIAALAKNGRLPPRPSHRSEEKREGEDDESWLLDHDDNSPPILGEEEDPDLFYFNDEDSRSGESGAADKRYLGAFLKSRGRPQGIESGSLDKRFVGAFFNSRGKPTLDLNDEEQNNGKRNIASLARKGWLSAIRSYRSPVGQRMPTPRRYSSYNDKRDDSLYSDEPQAITTSSADDCFEDEEQFNSIEKRNIAFLARNGLLPPRKAYSDPFSLKRNRPSFLPQTAPRWLIPNSSRLQSGQLRLVKIKPKRCPTDNKRNVAAMARKGLLPDKKNIASMASKGMLPGK